MRHTFILDDLRWLLGEKEIWHIRRIYYYFKLIQLVNNWREVIHASHNLKSFKGLILRDGIVLNGPQIENLIFLFSEIWIFNTYNRFGYNIQPGDRVLDIGANVGIFSVYAATRAPGVKVYAYEPYPENVDWLKRNIIDNHLTNIEVHSQAAGDVSGMRFLQLATNPGGHSLLSKESEKSGMQVHCVSLDEIFETNGIDQCDFLKIDTEGSEYEILHGCSSENLRKIKRIALEYHEGVGIGGTGKELRRFLESKSFCIDRYIYSDIHKIGILYAKNN